MTATSAFVRAFLTTIVVGGVSVANAAPTTANARAGRELFMRSCVTCHATEDTSLASDHAPPLLSLARANKERPASIRGRLMNPHPPMPNLMLSRRQIADIIAYLNSVPI